MSTPLPLQTEEHFSAGGVVIRLDHGEVQVVLCGRNAPLLWCLPKGTPSEGETIQQTALREVREETGLDVVLRFEVGHIEYWFGKPSVRVHKRVYFYLMEPTGGTTERHDVEFDKVTWFPASKALEMLTYPNETFILGKAIEMVKNGRLKEGHAPSRE